MAKHTDTTKRRPLFSLSAVSPQPDARHRRPRRQAPIHVPAPRVTGQR
jgi:hypothetical protein